MLDYSLKPLQVFYYSQEYWYIIYILYWYDILYIYIWLFCLPSTLYIAIKKNNSIMMRILPVNKATCCFRISKRFPSRSWDLMTIQKGFGKALTGLQLSCFCCWTKTPYSSCCQVINNSWKRQHKKCYKSPDDLQESFSPSLQMHWFVGTSMSGMISHIFLVPILPDGW